MSEGSPIKLLDGFVFSSPESLTEDQIREKGIRPRDFADAANVDLDGDGLKENVLVVNQRWDRRFRVGVGMVDTLNIHENHNNQLMTLDYQDSENPLLLVGLIDYNQDGLLDIATQLTHSDSSLVSYSVFLNQSPQRTPPGQPQIISLTSVDSRGWEEIRAAEDDSGEQVTIDVDGVVTSVTIHPENASFIQIDNNRLTPLHTGEAVTLSQPANPYSRIPMVFDNVFSLTFYDKNKDPIRSYTFTQRLPEMTSQKSEKGIVYVLFSGNNSTSYDEMPQAIRALMPILDEKIEHLAELWGEEIVNRAIRKVVVSEQPILSSAEDWRLSQGVIYLSQHVEGYDPGVEGPSHEMALAQIAFHEIAHNIEFFFLEEQDTGMLQETFDDLIDQKSPVFDFIRDSHFLNTPYEMGHPSDYATETFATMTVLICAGAEQFEDAWARFVDETPDLSVQERVRDDLTKLLKAYRQSLRNNSADTHHDEVSQLLKVLSKQEK